MKKAEKKRTSLLANLGDINRPLRVRPVRVMGRQWWAVDAEDTWAGMVMDLRRLGFESMAWEDEVLVREAPVYEPQMEGPAQPTGLKPFPLVQATIQILREATYSTNYNELSYFDEYNEDEDGEVDDEFEPDELQYE